MQLRATAGVFVLLLTLASPLVALAQSDTGSDTDARALFEQGRVAYDGGQFEDAVRAFRRAYVLSPRFPLLYNIGQAELRAGHDQLALDAFEGFLRQAPADDSRRSEVEERIRVLRAMGVSAPTREEVREATATETQTTTETTTTETTESTETTETTETTPPPPPPTGDSGPGAVPWVIVGVGGALIVAGAVMMGIGASDSSRVTGATRGTTWADISGAASEANTLWGVGIALLVTGGVAAAAGIGWAVAGGGGSSDQPSARLRIVPGGLTLEGAF